MSIGMFKCIENEWKTRKIDEANLRNSKSRTISVPVLIYIITIYSVYFPCGSSKKKQHTVQFLIALYSTNDRVKSVL